MSYTDQFEKAIMMDPITKVNFEVLDKIQSFKLKANILGLNITLAEFDDAYNKVRYSFQTLEDSVSTSIKHLAVTVLTAVKILKLKNLRTLNELMFAMRRKYSMEGYEPCMKYAAFDSDVEKVQEKWVQYKHMTFEQKKDVAKGICNEWKTLIEKVKSTEQVHFHNFDKKPNDMYQDAKLPHLFPEFQHFYRVVKCKTQKLEERFNNQNWEMVKKFGCYAEGYLERLVDVKTVIKQEIESYDSAKAVQAPQGVKMLPKLRSILKKKYKPIKKVRFDGNLKFCQGQQLRKKVISQTREQKKQHEFYLRVCDGVPQQLDEYLIMFKPESRVVFSSVQKISQVKTDSGGVPTVVVKAPAVAPPIVEQPQEQIKQNSNLYINHVVVHQSQPTPTPDNPKTQQPPNSVRTQPVQPQTPKQAEQQQMAPDQNHNNLQQRDFSGLENILQLSEQNNNSRGSRIPKHLFSENNTLRSEVSNNPANRDNSNNTSNIQQQPDKLENNQVEQAMRVEVSTSELYDSFCEIFKLPNCWDVDSDQIDIFRYGLRIKRDYLERRFQSCKEFYSYLLLEKIFFADPKLDQEYKFKGPDILRPSNHRNYDTAIRTAAKHLSEHMRTVYIYADNVVQISKTILPPKQKLLKVKNYVFEAQEEVTKSPYTVDAIKPLEFYIDILKTLCKDFVVTVQKIKISNCSSLDRADLELCRAGLISRLVFTEKYGKRAITMRECFDIGVEEINKTMEVLSKSKYIVEE